VVVVGYNVPIQLDMFSEEAWLLTRLMLSCIWSRPVKTIVHLPAEGSKQSGVHDCRRGAHEESGHYRHDPISNRLFGTRLVFLGFAKLGLCACNVVAGPASLMYR
jgi:hypothetical protein